jgi:hypothetical protein
MIGPGGGAVLFAILFVLAAALLAASFLAGAVLVLVGSLKRDGERVRRVGWIVLGVWLVPASAWGYYWLVATERDRYRTLTKAEVMYGVPLPAGAQVNFRKLARRVQWATLPVPQTIHGVEYTAQVNFCGGHVCRGTLARDQDIEGFPCRAQGEVFFSETTGHIDGCTLARAFVSRGATWPPGTVVRTTFEAEGGYAPPEGAAPVRIGGLLVHSGLIVRFTREGRVGDMYRNPAHHHPDTRLEIGDIVLELQNSVYDVANDGSIHGGVLAGAAVVDGKPMNAGDRVVIPAGGH